MTSLVEKYRPLAIADFVGIAEIKAALTALAKDPYSSAWLFVGGPGLGKTTIGQALFEAIGGQVQHIPARMCDLETVGRVTESCNYVPLMGGWNLVLADEIDQATRPAQVAWLSSLDSTRFPPQTIFVFTSNNLEKIEDRFQSRCRVMEFEAPTTAEMVEFLAKVWKLETTATAPDFEAIAVAAKGNVRTALMKLEVKLLVAPKPAEQPRSWMESAKAAEKPAEYRSTPAAERVRESVMATPKKMHLAKGADGKYSRYEAGAGCPCDQCRRAA